MRVEGRNIFHSESTVFPTAQLWLESCLLIFLGADYLKEDRDKVFGSVGGDQLRKTSLDANHPFFSEYACPDGREASPSDE